MILCCGEALIDMIPEPLSDGREGFVPHPGGAVFNTSVALGRLGMRTGLLTGLSSDLFGQVLEQALEQSHVDVSLSCRSDRPSALAFVHLTDGQATYSFYDENSAGRLLSSDDLPDLPDEVRTLYFGGISLACEPCADTYAALLMRECGSRAIMIDPNIRPSFVQDAARFRARMERILPCADSVKVSDEDLDWLFPETAPIEKKAQRLLKQGPSLVVLTRGRAGATGFLASGEQVTVAARQVPVVDTIGAGDTFNAGLLAKLSELGVLTKPGLRDLTVDRLQQALAFGGHVASVTVSRAGANPPWLREL